MMIPSHVSHSVIAYVSVEDYSSVSSDLFGQIRRYDLTEEPLPSGDILKEVRFVEGFNHFSISLMFDHKGSIIFCL